MLCSLRLRRPRLHWPSAGQGGGAVGPVDCPAADLADGHLGILITEFTANEFVGHDLRVAVATTPAGEELVERGKVTWQPLGPQQLPTRLQLEPSSGPWSHVAVARLQRQWPAAPQYPPRRLGSLVERTAHPVDLGLLHRPLNPSASRPCNDDPPGSLTSSRGCRWARQGASHS